MHISESLKSPHYLEIIFVLGNVNVLSQVKTKITRVSSFYGIVIH